MVSDRSRTPSAARAALRTSRSTPGRAFAHAASSRMTSTFDLPVARVIGLDDAGHKIVAHHVFRGQSHEADAIDLVQRVDRIVETGFLPSRQVGLARIAGDDHA